MDRRPGLRIHERAAAGGQHLDRLAEQALDDPALAVAEGGLAVAFEDFFDGAARGAFDLGVGVDELQAQQRGQAASDTGLTGAHQADQHDGAGHIQGVGGRHDAYWTRQVP